MKVVLFLIIALFVIVKPSHAYLDPGTGSYVIQVVIASVAAGSYFFKDKIGMVVGKAKSLLTKNNKKNGKK